MNKATANKRATVPKFLTTDEIIAKVQWLSGLSHDVPVRPTVNMQMWFDSHEGPARMAAAFWESCGWECPWFVLDVPAAGSLEAFADCPQARIVRVDYEMSSRHVAPRRRRRSASTSGPAGQARRWSGTILVQVAPGLLLAVNSCWEFGMVNLHVIMGSSQDPAGAIEALRTILASTSQVAAETSSKRKPRVELLVPHGKLNEERPRPVQIATCSIPSVRDFYGDDFADSLPDLLFNIRETRTGGLALLSGPPGSGKTRFIHWLAGKLGMSIVVLSPENLSQNSRTIVGFLEACGDNALVVVEDAEMIVQASATARPAGLSNLLNIADGLAGRVLQQTILLTVNTDVVKLDPALLRPGRLFWQKDLPLIPEERARRILTSLGIQEEPTPLPTTLAGLFALGDKRRKPKLSDDILPPVEESDDPSDDDDEDEDTED